MSFLYVLRLKYRNKFFYNQDVSYFFIHIYRVVLGILYSLIICCLVLLPFLINSSINSIISFVYIFFRNVGRPVSLEEKLKSTE